MHGLLNKKGAMFGLDARIAMLIMTILGLLVFPIMNSIISKARVEAILASGKSVTRAIEEYIVDTGSIPATIDNLYTTLPTDAGQSTKWAGPYLKGEKTDRLVPTLSWTLENNSCITATTHRYCIYRVSYNFCKFPKSVFSLLGEYYSESGVGTSYNSTTKCITLDYGHNPDGAQEKFVMFKVKEQP